MSDERSPATDSPGPERGSAAEEPATHEPGAPRHDVQWHEDPAASQAWDPWAPPPPEQPAAAGQPVEQTQPVSPDQPVGREQPDHTRPVDHTQPVDLSHTQEISGAGAPPTAWAQEPTGWPGGQQPQPQGAPAHPAAAPYPGDHAAAAAAPGPQAGWDPITASRADGGYRGQQSQWAGDHPVPASAPHQKGPGWGALVAVAAVAALVAATLGGMFGGWLGATDRLGFGSLDRTPTSIPSAGAGSTARPEGSIANIAAKALPSVVTIKVKGADGAGTGSGFVLDRDGHIITNNHVVASAADGGTIKVELSNGTEINATIAGRDSSYDLAVLKTSRTDLQPLVMGSSKDVVVGDQVIAVGAPLGLESSVTSGIVSALDRPVSPGGDGDQQSFINAIQTDAAINPGNSGGPLLDMQGHVIGINSAIARIPGSSDSQSGNIGVGFSIPSDQVVRTAAQLIKTGKALHPVIGVILDRQYTGEGVKILDSASGGSGNPVTPDGPAGKAGVKPGDVIVEFDGKPVNDPDDLVVAIRAKSVGDMVSMKVRRGSETISVTVTLTGTSGS
jgi:putative serine protease PepD